MFHSPSSSCGLYHCCIIVRYGQCRSCAALVSVLTSGRPHPTQTYLHFSSAISSSVIAPVFIGSCSHMVLHFLNSTSNPAIWYASRAKISSRLDISRDSTRSSSRLAGSTPSRRSIASSIFWSSAYSSDGFTSSAVASSCSRCASICSTASSSSADRSSARRPFSRRACHVACSVGPHSGSDSGPHPGSGSLVRGSSSSLVSSPKRTLARSSSSLLLPSFCSTVPDLVVRRDLRTLCQFS